MAPLWWRDIFRKFGLLLYVGTTPQTVIGLHSTWVRDMSDICRFWFGMGRPQFSIMSDLIRSWIGLVGIGVRSADICPLHNRSKTNKPSTIGGRIKADTSPITLIDKTDITPTSIDSRQVVGYRSFNHNFQSIIDEIIAWALAVKLLLGECFKPSMMIMALVRVLAWCRQATSDFLNQCWPSSMLTQIYVARWCY